MIDGIDAFVKCLDFFRNGIFPRAIDVYVGNRETIVLGQPTQVLLLVLKSQRSEQIYCRVLAERLGDLML